MLILHHWNKAEESCSEPASYTTDMVLWGGRHDKEGDRL
jgi:hypothetical protein